MAAAVVLTSYLRSLNLIIGNSQDNAGQQQAISYELDISFRMLRTVIRSLLKTPLRSNAHELQQLAVLAPQVKDSLVDSILADIKSYLVSDEFQDQKRRVGKYAARAEHKQQHPMWWYNRAIEPFMPSDEMLRLESKCIASRAVHEEVPLRIAGEYADFCTNSVHIKSITELVIADMGRKQQLAARLEAKLEREAQCCPVVNDLSVVASDISHRRVVFKVKLLFPDSSIEKLVIDAEAVSNAVPMLNSLGKACLKRTWLSSNSTNVNFYLEYLTTTNTYTVEEVRITNSQMGDVYLSSLHSLSTHQLIDFNII
jgi:hypothetical protein